MEDPDNQMERYRAWAMLQPDLCIFQTPTWLDVVAPDWRVERGEGWWWPYARRKQFGLVISQLPICTPYLGPILLEDCDLDRLPQAPDTVDYILYTSFQPALAIAAGKHARSMATQRITLPQSKPFGKTLCKRILRGRKELTIERFPPSVAEMRSLAGDQQFPVPERFFEVFKSLGSMHEVDCISLRHADNLVGIQLCASDQVVTYGLLQMRARNASSDTGALLMAELLEVADERSSQVLDLCGGYLPGVRSFNAGFGAKLKGYTQVRYATTPAVQAADWIRSLTNSRRL